MATPEEKLRRIVAVFASELGKALAGAEDPAARITEQLCTAEERAQLERTASDENDSGGGGCATDVGRTVRSIVARVQRLEQTLRTAEAGAARAAEARAAAEARVAWLEREAHEHKRLFEHEHSRLVALEKEREQRRLQEKRDLFKLLEAASSSETAAASAAASPTVAVTVEPSSLSPEPSPRRAHHQRFASVGGVLVSPRTALEDEPAPATPKTTLELIAHAETLLAQAEEDRKANLRVPTSMLGVVQQQQGSPARRRAGSVLESLFEPLRMQKSADGALQTTVSAMPSSPLVDRAKSPTVSPTPGRRHRHKRGEKADQ